MTRIIEDNGVYSQPDYSSATAISSAANYIMNSPEPFTHTFRTYIRLRENGSLTLKFWHSNSVDSTWDLGQDANGSEPGGEWSIEAAYVSDGGSVPDGAVTAGTSVPLTFAGSRTKQVEAGETFWSDEASLELPEGHYLAFTWTIKTSSPAKHCPTTWREFWSQPMTGRGIWPGRNRQRRLACRTSCWYCQAISATRNK